MRWTRAAPKTRALTCGRRSRVVLTPRRWCQVGERDFTGDGGKKARSPGRARNKLLKPSRAGMPGDPGATVVTNARAYYHYTRGCGCNGHPAFPTPSLGGDKCTTRALCVAGRKSVSGLYPVIASVAKQSTLAFLLLHGLLRFARNDGNHGIGCLKPKSG